MASTDEDIVNMALRYIGAEPITDLTSSTEKGALVANDFYAETVKEIQYCHPWNCLKRRTTLNRFGKQPAFEWDYRYALPSDFLRLEKLNGTNAWEPQDFYEIESFQDTLVTNDSFLYSTYDTDESADLLDDWTVVTSPVTRDTTNDQMVHTGPTKIKQTIHCLPDGDHTVTAIIGSNTGSGEIRYIVEDTDERQLATTTTSAGYTGTTTLNFYSDLPEAVLFVNCQTVGATVKHDSVKVACSDAPDHVLLTDADSAEISYISNRTDVTEWTPGLTEAIALAIAHKLSISMRQDEQLAEMLYKKYRRALSSARKTDGGNIYRRQIDIAEASRFVSSRWQSTNG